MHSDYTLKPSTSNCNNSPIETDTLTWNNKNISKIAENKNNNFFYLMFDTPKEIISYDCKQHVIYSRKSELINISCSNYSNQKIAIQDKSIIKNSCLNIATISTDIENINTLAPQIVYDVTHSIKFSAIPLDFSVIFMGTAIYYSLYNSVCKPDQLIISADNIQQDNKNIDSYYNHLYSMLANSVILTFIKFGINSLYNNFAADYYYHCNSTMLKNDHGFMNELIENKQFKINKLFTDINLAKIFYVFKQAINCGNDKSYNLYKAINLALVEQWIYQNQLGDIEDLDTLTSIIQKIIIIILYDYNFTKNLFHYDTENLANAKYANYAISTISNEKKQIEEQQQESNNEKFAEYNSCYLTTMETGFYSALGADSILYIGNIKKNKRIYKIYNPILQIEATTNLAENIDDFFKKIAENIIFKKLSN